MQQLKSNTDREMSVTQRIFSKGKQNFIIVAALIVLVLIFALSESLSQPLITAMLATGRIRNYQIIVGGLQMMNLPLSYFLLKFGFIPETIIGVAIFISQCCLAARLILLRKMIGLPPKEYLKKVYLNVLLVTSIAFIMPFFAARQLEESFLSFIILCILTVICTGATIYYIGCNKAERLFLLNKVHNIRNKILRK